MCREALPKKNINVDAKSVTCLHALQNRYKATVKFSPKNNMNPGSVPELSDLTWCAEMLIARAFPVTQLYVRKGHDAISYNRHILTVPHNVQNVANILPQCPENLPVIVFAVNSRNKSDSFFKVKQKN